MIDPIFIAVTTISPTVHRSLPVTEHKYPMMHYSKQISVEHFTAGRPLATVLPLAEEHCTNKGVGYLIEELHTSGHWPVLVYNVGYKMDGNMYTEIQQQGSYIILISGPCEVWEEHTARYLEVSQQLLSNGCSVHVARKLDLTSPVGTRHKCILVGVDVIAVTTQSVEQLCSG